MLACIGVAVGAALIVGAWLTRTQAHRLTDASIAPPTPAQQENLRRAIRLAGRPDASDNNRGVALDYFYGSTTPEERQWLRRNGYPDGELLRQLMTSNPASAPIDKDRLADPAMAVIAEQVALRDPARRAEAMNFLSRAAEAGSLYALTALARAYADGPQPDPVRAAAFQKAAELRGDWTMGLAQLQKRELSANEKLYALLMGHLIIENIDRNRAGRGLSPLPRQARPGLPKLLEDLGRRQQQ